jgi:hypothetical protein
MRIPVQYAGVATEEQTNYYQGLPHPAEFSEETPSAYQPEVH